MGSFFSKQKIGFPYDMVQRWKELYQDWYNSEEIILHIPEEILTYAKQRAGYNSKQIALFVADNLFFKENVLPDDVFPLLKLDRVCPIIYHIVHVYLDDMHNYFSNHVIGEVEWYNSTYYQYQMNMSNEQKVTDGQNNLISLLEN